MSADENGLEAIVSTTSGTIWFISWAERATIKVKSTHSPLHMIRSAEFKYIPPGQMQI